MAEWLFTDICLQNDRPKIVSSKRDTDGMTHYFEETYDVGRWPINRC